VKRKGNRTNRNPATAGKSIMLAELQESACQRMADDLDAAGGVYLTWHFVLSDFISMYLI
jgi:hypothetical protein